MQLKKEKKKEKKIKLKKKSNYFAEEDSIFEPMKPEFTSKNTYLNNDMFENINLLEDI